MPIHPSRTLPVVDVPPPSRTDEAGRSDGHAKFTQETSTDPAVTGRDASSGYRTLVEEGRRKPSHLATSVSRRGNSIQPNDSVHIAPAIEADAGRRTVETSIWDWDSPRESFADNLSNDYELQGELLIHESRDQLPVRTEFNLPSAFALSPGAGHWPFPASAVGSWNVTSNEGFAVPPRRCTTISPSIAGNKRKVQSDRDLRNSSSENTKKSTRPVVMADSTSEAPSSPSSSSAAPSTNVTQAPSRNTRSQAATSSTGLRSVTENTDLRTRRSMSEIESQSRAGATAESVATGIAPRRATTDTVAALSLPTRKVFPIQIGDKLFRLSGASISSDAPSYFSRFFEEQLRQNEGAGADGVRTLYIDRDPVTFEDISLHLQGYHIEPRDGPHFVRLFADAQFYGLPRLTRQLFSSTIYIRIGDSEFQIPRDLFSSPGDTPNYFSLGFSSFFTTPTDALPGLAQRTLLRPPSILPPSVPNRSAKTFADLLHILKGYPVEIRGEQHRAELLRDTRYFHLKGLEQKLIPHEISYNLARRQSEILIRLEDIRQSGVSFVADGQPPPSAPVSPSSRAPHSTSNTLPGPGWVHYQRPYVDAAAHSLVIEIGGEESTYIALAPQARDATFTARIGHAIFHQQTLTRIVSLFTVVANKINIPINQPFGLHFMEQFSGSGGLSSGTETTGFSKDFVKVRLGPDADILLNGKKWLNQEGRARPAADPSVTTVPARRTAPPTLPTRMNIDPSSSSSRSESRIGSRRAKRKRLSQAQTEAPSDSEEAQSDDTDSDDDEEDDNGSGGEGEEWIVKKAQWRLRVQPLPGSSKASAGASVSGASSSGGGAVGRAGMEIILGAVKIDAFSKERARNRQRGFLA